MCHANYDQVLSNEPKNTSSLAPSKLCPVIITMNLTLTISLNLNESGAINKQLTLETCLSLIQLFDQNNDGVIDREEFVFLVEWITAINYLQNNYPKDKVMTLLNQPLTPLDEEEKVRTLVVAHNGQEAKDAAGAEAGLDQISHDESKGSPKELAERAVPDGRQRPQLGPPLATTEVLSAADGDSSPLRP